MSRRLLPALLALALAAGACMPGFAPISAADSQATAIALAGTLAAHTLAALPSPTLPATNTPFPTSTPVIAPAATETPTQTVSAAASASLSPTAATGSPAPAATATGSPTASPTASAAASGTTTPTATPTLGVLIHGTMPPAVPYGFVTLINYSKKVVYIAFRCTFGDNQTTLAEYPVYGTYKITLPAGYCEWRAWVRGQEFTGSIHIKRFEEYTFTFKQNRVIVAP